MFIRVTESDRVYLTASLLIESESTGADRVDKVDLTATRTLKPMTNYRGLLIHSLMVTNQQTIRRICIRTADPMDLNPERPPQFTP